MLEPPYGIIWDLLKDGKVIPFLGAGASMGSRPVGTRWDPGQPTFVPSGVELADFLASKSQFPSQDPRDTQDLAKVASYYADISGRSRLRERLRELFDRDFQSGALHHFLAALPAECVIVVTNYDTLLEQAFRAAGRAYDLVVYPSDLKDFANAVLWWPHGASKPTPVEPNLLDIDLASTTVIYKMHGSVIHEAAEWDSFVITEEDYVEFLSRMIASTNSAVPAIFFPYFRDRSFLFLGYGLRDWNLRVVLKNLSRYLSSRSEEPLPSWALQRNPSELERLLWQKRNVSIFDIDLEDFVRKMRTQMRAEGASI